MLRRRVPAKIQQAVHANAPQPTFDPEARKPHQIVNIDELCTSPWIGLHYRYEFMLHHRHELLEQHTSTGDAPEI